jgi:hypothetical protein
MKRSRSDEAFGIVIHICMETTQEYYLCNLSLSQTSKKCHVSFFYLLCFFFYNFEEHEGGTGFDVGRCWHQWEDGGGGDRGKSMNTVQIMCTHVYKCKNGTC